MKPDKIVIIDFGSQYTKLIARKVRESKHNCERSEAISFLEITSSLRSS